MKNTTSYIFSALYFAILGPLIALLFAVPVVLLSIKDDFSALPLVVLIGLPLVYIVGFIPALLTGIAAKWLPENRGKIAVLAVIGAALSNAAGFIAFRVSGLDDIGLNAPLVGLFGAIVTLLLYWPMSAKNGQRMRKANGAA
ncbi:hypothetical protein [Enterobacillus tribolii]|uniref:Inner membrane protein CbrB n=1 Tax=Enterobacillus tribolii TaxID=1487935 RepID=A0A370R4N6_9GAMM|nr:hypothetical protein [Enterobacillus tribolii]MBW7983332.1 hypothetical protein [Enterobacillus tribolii]RDK97389.1 hypothetical protein C8D90_101837 [Enterobacillus tribolii]